MTDVHVVLQSGRRTAILTSRLDVRNQIERDNREAKEQLGYISHPTFYVLLPGGISATLQLIGFGHREYISKSFPRGAQAFNDFLKYENFGISEEARGDLLKYLIGERAPVDS